MSPVNNPVTPSFICLFLCKYILLQGCYTQQHCELCIPLLHKHSLMYIRGEKKENIPQLPDTFFRSKKNNKAYAQLLNITYTCVLLIQQLLFMIQCRIVYVTSSVTGPDTVI